MVKAWCPHLDEWIHVSKEALALNQGLFRCACSRPTRQTTFEPNGTVAQAVIEEMPIVKRPARKGGNFLKAAMIKGDSAKVVVQAVRTDVDLPAGTATVLDVIYAGEPYGFPLNVTNHRALCKLYGNVADETFDTAKVEGKTITLKKVMANNPREHKEVETLRIAA